MLVVVVRCGGDVMECSSGYGAVTGGTTADWPSRATVWKQVESNGIRKPTIRWKAALGVGRSRSEIVNAGLDMQIECRTEINCCRYGIGMN